MISSSDALIILKGYLVDCMQLYSYLRVIKNSNANKEIKNISLCNVLLKI